MKRSGDFWPLYGRKRARPQPASASRAPSPWVVAYIDGMPYTAAMLERRAARLATCPESAALEGDDQIVYVGEGQGL